MNNKKSAIKNSKSTLISIRVPNFVLNDIKMLIEPCRSMTDIILFSVADYIVSHRCIYGKDK